MAADYEQIERLLGEGKTVTEIALITGVSVATVSRFRKKLEAESAPAAGTTGDAARDEYRQTLRRLLPVAARAKKLAELAQSKQPAVALRAIELADQISGLGPDQQTPPATVPMFALPEATKTPFKQVKPKKE